MIHFWNHWTMGPCFDRFREKRFVIKSKVESLGIVEKFLEFEV